MSVISFSLKATHNNTNAAGILNAMLHNSDFCCTVMKCAVEKQLICNLFKLQYSEIHVVSLFFHCEFVLSILNFLVYDPFWVQLCHFNDLTASVNLKIASRSGNDFMWNKIGINRIKNFVLKK